MGPDTLDIPIQHVYDDACGRVFVAEVIEILYFLQESVFHKQVPHYWTETWGVRFAG